MLMRFIYNITAVQGSFAEYHPRAAGTCTYDISQDYIFCYWSYSSGAILRMFTLRRIPQCM